MATNYRTRFAYRIDMWDADGENILDHLATRTFNSRRRPTWLHVSAGPGHQSPCASAHKSSKTIAGPDLGKER
jgi:hypothetical protein